MARTVEPPFFYLNLLLGAIYTFPTNLSMMQNETILEIKNLSVSFYLLAGVSRAVRGVCLDLEKGETLGLVGESGSGKSVTALSIMRLFSSPPAKIDRGEINFEGTDLIRLSEAEMRKIRGREISMIFQEPMTSLNPVLTVGSQIAEAILTHQKMKKKEATNLAIEMLDLVGINPAAKRINEYPHQLSGGMRQRVMIAMALACRPKLLIADEPTTALDVTTQAQILNLILKLKEQMSTSMIIISHNLGVIAEMSQQIGVMYAGKLVEIASAIDLFENPLHPYTQGLLKSIPRIETDYNKNTNPLKEIPGAVPTPTNLPAGCKFNPRCPHCFDQCAKEEPPLITRGSQHSIRCWLES